jgi:hypothetical protein
MIGATKKYPIFAPFEKIMVEKGLVPLRLSLNSKSDKE